MGISDHLTEFGGFRVQPWEPGQPLADPKTIIHRLSVEWDEQQLWIEKFRAFLELPEVEQIEGLVVGMWAEWDEANPPPTNVIEALTNAYKKFPKLHVLFFGDIINEEYEVSWIIQSDLSPILAAYSKLTHLGIRGSNGLSLGQINLPSLKNSDYQNQITQAVAQAPVLDHLETLDLSLGTLTDEGAEALLNSEKLRHLKKLDLHYHWLSDEMMTKVQAQLPQADLSEQQEIDDDFDPEEDAEDIALYRYVALGE